MSEAASLASPLLPRLGEHPTPEVRRTLHHRLRLGKELVEAEDGRLYEYGHRLTLYVLQYDEANFSPFSTPAADSSL
jgi:hypothetical protein